jgi:lysophospholipase L1-like esterase
VTQRYRALLTGALTVLLLATTACSQELTDPAATGGRQAKTTGGEPARIVFLGDSITEAGAKPGGYVSLVESSLRRLYPGRRIEVLAAGEVGNRVPDLLDRLRRDVLSESPTHVVIYVGVNDVGRQPPPGGNTGLAEYRDGLDDLVNRIRASGAHVILCTPGVIGENLRNPTPENRLLDQYAEASRQVAATNGARICDLRAAFDGYLEEFNTKGRNEGILTYDGVHLNADGNRFVARQMLHVLGQELQPSAQRLAGRNPDRS